MPDRAELENILSNHWISFSGLSPDPDKIRASLITTLLAWAQGEKEKIWCSHMKWRPEEEAWLLDYNTYISDWDICPVKGCHKPRPT